MTAPARIGIVGNGWRVGFFHRIAAALPERFEIVGVVTRSAVSAEAVARDWHVDTYPDAASLVSASAPDFVIVSVSWEAAPTVISTLVELGVPVLSETPPAPDLEGLRALWERVGQSGLVQVAEQYPLYPGHAARAELVRRGTIGEPTSVQLSSTHLYHALALIRGFLNAGFGPVTVDARSFQAPLADPMGRDDWNEDFATPKTATTTIATLDFGGTMGLYDFTDNQWHNQLRHRRMLIRGSLGEIDGDEVVLLSPERRIVEASLVRRQTGYDLDLDGYDTDHISFGADVLWVNPFPRGRFADEEIAIGGILTGMSEWIAGSAAAPYPLAEASQDHLIGLAIGKSLETGKPETTEVEAWGVS